MEPDASLKENALLKREASHTPLLGQLRRNYSSSSGYQLRKRRYCTNNEEPPLTFNTILLNWKEIIGPGNRGYGGWVSQLTKHVSKTTSKEWRTPYKTFRTSPLEEMAKKKELRLIGDPFIFNTSEEKKAIAKFLARKGVALETLEILFSKDIMDNISLNKNDKPAQDPQDCDLTGPSEPSGRPLMKRQISNEEPEPVLPRENLYHQNKKPRLDLDLNKSPTREQVEPDVGDGGGD
jgi:hypothetical protein